MKIPEIKITLSPENDEARDAIGFKWAGQDSEGRTVGERHKIGGYPDWLQTDETPKCECGKEMSFYGQLDSIGDNFCLADCGMIYVFVCHDCLSTKSILQSY